jgi:predicted TIM-barrel fold metal-dependent hydrolase
MTSSSNARPLLFDSHAHLVAHDEVRYPRDPMQRAADAPYRPPGVIGRPGGHGGPNAINEVPDALRMLRWMEEENVDGIVTVQKRMIHRYDREAGLPADQVLRRAADMFGADHLMRGSDIGTSSATYKDTMQRMLDASALLKPGERRAVWHDTGRRVFVKGGHRRSGVLTGTAR